VEPCKGLGKCCDEFFICCNSIGNALDKIFAPCCAAIGTGFAACCLVISSLFDIERPFGCCRLITVIVILCGFVLAVFSFLSTDDSCDMSPTWLPVQFVFMLLNLMYTFYFFKKVNYSDEPFDQRLHNTVMINPVSALMIIVEIVALIWSIMGLSLMQSECASERYCGWIALISMLMIIFAVLFVISCLGGVYCAKATGWAKWFWLVCCFPCAILGDRMILQAEQAEERDRQRKLLKSQPDSNPPAVRNDSIPASPPQERSNVYGPTIARQPPAVPFHSEPANSHSPHFHGNSGQPQDNTSQPSLRIRDQQHDEKKEHPEPPTLSGMMFKGMNKGFSMARETLIGKPIRKEHIARV